MLNFGERKDLLVLFIIAVLIVVAIMIFSLIMIWSPKVDDQFYVGKIKSNNNNNISTEYKLSTYLEIISKLLVQGKYEEIYNEYLSKDYIQYYKLDVNSLKEKCDKLKISGQELVLNNFTVKQLEGYNNIYIVNALTMKEAYSVRFVLREISPKNFTISFDEFVLQDKKIDVKTTENIVIDIQNIIYTSQDVTFNLKITNKNSGNVVINCYEKQNPFVLNYNTDDYLDASSQNNLQKIILTSGETTNLNLKYKIENIDWSSIRSITINDVKLSDNRTIDIEFDI